MPQNAKHTGCNSRREKLTHKGRKMKTKRELIQMFNRGELEALKHECMAHGETITDRDWICEEGHYKGHNHILRITHKNLKWEFDSIDGEIKRVSYTVTH